MSRKKPDLLRARYGLGATNLLGKGMETEAYAYGEAQVLKVYTNDLPLEQLRTLQAFYANLDASGLGYQLPYIFRVWEEEGLVLCLERRLPGVALSTRLADLSEGALEALLQRYVTAIVKLRQVRFRQPPQRYKLFDPDGLSLTSRGDFNTFLSRYLDARLALCEPLLRRDVKHWEAKLTHLRALLAQPYTGEYALVHGDFFPANLLVDDQNHISALLDFGWMTLYGDPRYDLATGWIFFDLYDELKRNVRARLEPVVRTVVSEGEMGILYRYILFYSIFTANVYAYEGGERHYWWCVGNLNNPAYWAGLG